MYCLLFAFNFFIVSSTIWLPPSYKINRLELRQLKTLRPQRENWQRQEMTDRAIVTFDLDIDLRKVWNWNVKQLFIYITARYVTKENIYNEIVIWDKIVNRTQDSRIKLYEIYNKYPIIDYGTSLRNTPITLTLNWDVMPITGTLYSQTVQTSSIKMPSVYCTEIECKPEPLPLQYIDRPNGLLAKNQEITKDNQPISSSPSNINNNKVTFNKQNIQVPDDTMSVEIPVNGEQQMV